MSVHHERLKALRKSKSALQKDMAALLDIQERQYRRYEAGTIDPPTSKTVALADCFNVSIDYLVGRSDAPERR
jgi:transcriptional regulator with XRE-family HTH domain